MTSRLNESVEGVTNFLNAVQILTAPSTDAQMKRTPFSWETAVLAEAGRCEKDFWDGANQRTKNSANRGCREAFDQVTQRGLNVCVTWRSAECRPFPAPDRPTLVRFRCSALVLGQDGSGEVVKTFADCVPVIPPGSLTQRTNKKRGIDSSEGSSRSEPQASTTGFQPQASTTGFQHQASTAGYRPQASTTGFSPGPRYDPKVYDNYRPYAPTTQPSTASGSSFDSGSKYSCIVGDSYGARPTYGTGPPRSESISSFADLPLRFGRSASYGTYSRGGSLTIGASRTGGQGPEPPGDDLIAAEGSIRQKKGKTPVEEKPYTCTVCGFSYESSRALQAHMKSHTEETYCAICKFNLSSVSTYNRHMQQHQGIPKREVEKKFRCTHDQCSKSFTTANNLREHSKTHTGETFCPYCFTNFGTVAILRDHIGDKHKEEQNMHQRKKKSF